MTESSTQNRQLHENLLVQLEELQKIKGMVSNEFFKGAVKCRGEGRWHYTSSEKMSETFCDSMTQMIHSLLYKVSKDRKQIHTWSDPLLRPVRRRLKRKLEWIVDGELDRCMGETSHHTYKFISEKISGWGGGSAKMMWSVTLKNKRDVFLKIPYAVVKDIKKGVVFIDNKIVLQTWDKEKSVDNIESAACIYLAMDRSKKWGERQGQVAWMEVEGAHTISAIAPCRDKAVSTVRAKVRKETLKRMGLA